MCVSVVCCTCTRDDAQYPAACIYGYSPSHEARTFRQRGRCESDHHCGRRQRHTRARAHAHVWRMCELVTRIGTRGPLHSDACTSRVQSVARPVSVDVRPYVRAHCKYVHCTMPSRELQTRNNLCKRDLPAAVTPCHPLSFGNRLITHLNIANRFDFPHFSLGASLRVRNVTESRTGIGKKI